MISQHAEREYPAECCGFLIGNPKDTRSREASRILPAVNASLGEKHRRFLIAPEELRTTELGLEGSGEAVVGFYHSHPDQAPVPSECDLANAWPWYTYLIVAVGRGTAARWAAFELDGLGRRFSQVRISTTAAIAPLAHPVPVGSVP